MFKKYSILEWSKPLLTFGEERVEHKLVKEDRWAEDTRPAITKITTESL